MLVRKAKKVLRVVHQKEKRPPISSIIHTQYTQREKNISITNGAEGFR